MAVGSQQSVGGLSAVCDWLAVRGRSAISGRLSVVSLGTFGVWLAVGGKRVWRAGGDGILFGKILHA